MEGDGSGGTEVSVKITCDEGRRWFQKRALSGQKEKKRKGEREEE